MFLKGRPYFSVLCTKTNKTLRTDMCPRKLGRCDSEKAETWVNRKKTKE
jgi:hypothetical protein